MNLNFNKTFKGCCTWLLFGLLFMGFSPDAIAHYLTIKNEGDCAVNIYKWVTTGDIFKTTLQPGQNYRVTGLNGTKYRAVDTNNDWQNLVYDQHYMFNNNTYQNWTINPTYCNNANTGGCSGEITDFLLNKQDGSALQNLSNGATYCESDFPNDIRIRTKESGTHESLRYTITGPTGTWVNVENYVTYDSKQFWPTPGEWTVKAQLYKGHDASGTKCDEKTIKFKIRDCNAVTIPSLNCDNSDFKFEGSDKFIYSSNTIEVKDLPAIFHNAPFVKITEIITSDSYDSRVNRNQTDEQLKLVFKKNGQVTGVSDYTPDLQDNVKTAFFQGTLPNVQLNGGADKVYIVHPGNPDLGEDVRNSANSLDLKGLCLMAGAIIDPCANGGAPVATVLKNDPTCGNNDGKFTFSFDDRAGRTNIEFSIDGGNTFIKNVKDDTGSTMISDLENGSYDLYVRWGNDECPVSLGTFALTDGSQAPGTDCDDNNANTTNDVILADGCSCAGTVPAPVYDCPQLEANIGDACNDGNADTENDVVTANCNCEGTIPAPVYDCSQLEANIGDACNDGNALTLNDVVTANCDCAGIIPTPVYDCPQLSANIGDACNDGNADTENDVVTANCNCQGSPINILLPNILINSVVVNEADGTATLTVGIDQVSATDVVVDFATTDGTANAGVDYAAFSGSITIPAGQQSVTLTFDILEDTTDETDELFNVLLSNPQGALIVGGLGSVTILDNDEPVVPGGCSAAYTVDGNVITITGVTGAMKTVKVLDEGWNTVFSCDEWSTVCNATESVTISSCGTYYVQVQTYADWSTPICNIFETVVISDGCGTGVDCPGLGLNFGAPCNDGNPNTINDVVMQDCGCYGTPVGPQYDCPLLQANVGDACDDFNPNTQHDVVQDNCACVGQGQSVDCNATYTVDGRTINISNLTGAVKTVKIIDQDWNTLYSCDSWSTPCGDDASYTVDACGSYFVQIQTYVDWNTPICNIFETVEITEGCGTGTLPSLTIGDIQVIEDAGLVQVDVCLDAISSSNVSVEYGTNNGTATANDDYTGNLGTLVIPAGELCGVAEVLILEDLDIEPTEQLFINLSNPQGATIADGEGVVTILDNDDVAPVIPNISIDDVVVNEADGTASLTIAIDQIVGTDVVVDFATNDGSAIAGIDYAALTGTVTIPAGQQFVTVTFDILEDTTDEADEVFNVVLSNPQGGVISGNIGTVTILDNDEPIGPIYDCPALGANIGDACDDGNADTNNDVVQADCSCAGMPMNNPTCAATYSVSDRTITVENVTGAITAVKIIDNSWNVLFECNDWATPCQETEAFTVPTCGTYFVQVQTYADWSTPICNLFETVVIDTDCDGGSPDPDCPALDANIGDACDDGDAATSNDVVRDDCTCAGTLVVTPPACDNVTDGGAIAGDETLEAGTAASPITSAQLPSGGTGTIEYIWLSATDRCPRFLSDTIPGAYSSTYDPGVLTETTYFVRCSRRAGCAENTDWQFGESNCVVKEVVASSPNNICAEREALNTRTCRTDVLYGVWLQGEAYTIRDGKFIEYTDGTAKFTGHANGIGDIDVTFEGRVYHQDSVKFSGCLGETPTDDWYYYTTFSGTLGQYSVSPRGPIFQVGTGANVQQANEFGGAAWFDTHDGLKGDFNLRLTGAPELCHTVQARVSTNSFNAQIENGAVTLDWTNNTGSQNDYFEVERSIDGQNFESIGVYETQGLDDTPTFYTSEDGSPLEGFNFYRLKLTFLDGTFEYSDIRRVKISDIESFGIFPNPAREYVNVSLKGYTGKDINIQLLNQMGQPLKSVQLENVEDQNYTIELDGLNNGIYSIWIFAEGAKPVGKKMIVNKQY